MYSSKSASAFHFQMFDLNYILNIYKEVWSSRLSEALTRERKLFPVLQVIYLRNLFLVMWIHSGLSSAFCLQLYTGLGNDFENRWVKLILSSSGDGSLKHLP